MNDTTSKLPSKKQDLNQTFDITKEKMTNYIKRSPLANALVLHDFKINQIDIKNLFYYVERWISKDGKLTPTKMSLSGSENIRSGKKTITYHNGKRRLEKFQFEGVSGLWICALPDEVGTEMFDSIFDVHLHKEPNGSKTIVLCWDDEIIEFNREYLEDLARDLFVFLNPAYGYGFQRLFKQGPSFYPFGVLVGIDHFCQEAKQIGKWGKEYGFSNGKYKTGLLRDIYPINFLSNPHFDQKIDGVPLKKWIESSSDHGELKQLQDNFWSWWVPDEHIATVRDKFIESGLLLSY